MLTIHSITPAPRQSAADAALAAAVERWLPHAEGHELQAIRDELRSRGFDVLALVQAKELASSVRWLAGLVQESCTTTRVMTEEEADALGQAEALLDRIRGETA